MSTFRKFSALPAVAACLSLVAMPVQAAELPQTKPVQTVAPDAKPWDGQKAEHHHRYRRYRGYRHRNRIDAGDVFAGVLILGGIAAIASAAKKDRDERYRDRDYRYRDYRYRDRDYRDRDYRYRDSRSRYDTSRGIDRAVDMCLSRIERDVRVDTVDEVERDGAGWEVKGRLYDGEEFSCKIGSDGRIEDIDYDGADFDDRDRFSERQEDREEIERPEIAEDEAQRPAYPGGPLPGEEEPGEEV